MKNKKCQEKTLGSLEFYRYDHIAYDYYYYWDGDNTGFKLDGGDQCGKMQNL